ncbi:hypothetical protein G6F46_001087 [Rhizopus delemar]|uniref:DUF202 domain-containing protein n=2 Tax=Rhizopus TaxID=4842 RepID=A0A9P7CTL2_9FUNG|nr:hypothetical protein G6F55_003746 [Rhizopus delemar]KAG1552522.1 hypothetical protein G6F51_001172 [Rhizopus arrhizus]KAG1503004.1 hypothetical protein G6F54_001969 [Rhizopus delemar]KAG1524095.1 hypothetical protein G6F52_004480 [Rhizopus delemar]KAG1575613.1 hypothetical protein G6F50_000935 [Rhizopus delemar]
MENTQQKPGCSKNALQDESSESTDVEPPFLIRTKTKEEKDEMRQRYKEQQHNKHKKGPYKNKSATARDHLANERTFLAWLRTSLSLITVGVAITQLYHLSPQSNDQTKAGKSIGATFVVFSIVFLYFANARYFHTQIALTKGQFPASRGAVLFGSACILAVLIAMFIVILLGLN